MVFRVYKLEKYIPESLLEKGRKGRNYLFKLSEEVSMELDNPVMEDEKFYKMKSDLMGILKANNWLA